MKHIDIKGIIPPIITPMNSDESINYGELRNQVNRLIDGGVHGLFPFGTNGEAYILTPEEKNKILQVVIEEVNGRVPVYAGTGCIGTKETISMSKAAQSMGADVLSIITPWFAAASQAELYEHYKAVAQKVELPIVLYNIPARTGNFLSPSTAARLASIENIVAVKDSSGSFNNMLDYLSVSEKEDFTVLSGNDALIIWNLMAGGTGGIAGCANVFPKLMSSIYDFFISGETKKAAEANAKISSLRSCFKYGNPNTVVKAAVELLGYPVGKCRAPFNHIPDEGIAAIKKALDDCSIRGIQ